MQNLDLQKAYQKIQIDADDMHNSAFITPIGLFEYSKMPFGLIYASQFLKDIFTRYFNVSSV